MKISSRIKPPPGDGRNHRKQPHSATPCDPAHRLQRPAQKALIFRIPLPATFSGPGPTEHRPDPGHPLPAPIPAACPLPPTWPSKRGSELGEADPPAHIEALNPRQHPVEKAASIPPKGFNPWRNLNFRGPLPLPGSLPIHHRPQKRVKLSVRLHPLSALSPPSKISGNRARILPVSSKEAGKWRTNQES